MNEFIGEEVWFHSQYDNVSSGILCSINGSYGHVELKTLGGRPVSFYESVKVHVADIYISKDKLLANDRSK